MTRTRIQLDVTEAMRVLLDELVDATDATTRGEVLRKAISLYGVLMDAKKEGKTVEFVSSNGPKTRERLIII